LQPAAKGKHQRGGCEQERHHDGEGPVGRHQQQERTDQPAHGRDRCNPQQPFAFQGGDFMPEPDSAAEIARKDRNRTGRVGRDNGHAGIDERGKGEERAAAGNGVEHTGRERSGGKKKIVHHRR
jgi:hypothetical protein